LKEKNSMQKFRCQKFCLAITFIFLSAIVVFSQTTVETGERELKEAGKRAADAARAFNEIMNKTDKSIPRELLDRAEAVAVFPGVLKAAFLLGGRGGEGVISRRTPEGWSAPAFFRLGGGSFGLQIGADKTDYIMLFMNDGGLKGLLEDKFEFGGDVGIAAGPVGREASATTNLTLDAGILSYSRSKGAFVGASLKGTVIAPNKDLNKAVYNKTAKQILNSNEQTPVTDAVKVFPNTLFKYSNRRGKAIGNESGVKTSRQRTAVTVNGDNAIVVGNAPRSENPANNQSALPENVKSGEIYTVVSSRPSNELARNIRSELLELPRYGVFDWLEFQIASDNTIILRGQVRNAETRQQAETVTKNISGVSSVRNEIEILPVSQTDEDLREAVYKAVYSGQLARYSTNANRPIHIIVNNGRVTLKGSVETINDRNFAAAQARTVSGAIEINNELLTDEK
jgi:lipid-binding SYLF domain-containing protein